MTSTSHRRSPTVRRRRLSAEIRQQRLNANMTSTQASKELGWSQGKLTKMELGEWIRPNPRDVDDLCVLYGVDDAKRDELVQLASESKEKDGWWHPYRAMISEALSTYIGLEAGAAEEACYDSLVIPGLLQTEAYARAIVEAGTAELSPKQMDERVEIRARRQELLTRDDDPLRLWVVLDEGALRKTVGSAEVMREQLRHLLQMSELAKVTIQIIADSIGAHPGMTGPFTILTFPDVEGRPTVYVDTAAGQLFVEVAEEVKRFQIAFQRLQAIAGSPADSLRIIAELAK